MNDCIADKIEKLIDNKTDHQSLLGEPCNPEVTQYSPVQSRACVIVGSGTLAVYCAEQIRAAGHVLEAVLATDTVLQTWAVRENLHCVNSVEALTDYINQHPVDWLFSVVNPIILPASLIEQIREGAFNYHDAPLPRYAGKHATSWALLAHESHHAITWHRIAVAVDGGDIAIQRPIAIDADDTVLTLNLKCYQAALEGFIELLTGLGQRSLTTYPQVLAERSFYGKHRRPEAGAYLRWTHTAQDLSALARALDFGELYPNPLGCPKLLLKQGTVQVARVKRLNQRSGVAAGTVLNIEQDTWQVATSSEDVLISGFATLEGEPLSAQDLATQSSLRQGKRLPSLSPKQSRAITAIHEALAPSESFWQDRLTRLEPLQLPFEHRENSTEPKWAASTWCTPLRGDNEAHPPLVVLLATFAIYLARLTGQKQFQIGWRVNEAEDKLNSLACLAPVVPMEIVVDLDQPFAAVSHAIEIEHARLQRHHTFVRDLIARYPTLRSISGLRAARPWRIAASISSDETHSHLTPSAGAVGTLLTLQANASGAFRWIYDATRLDADQIQRISEHLQELNRASLSINNANMSIGKLNLLTRVERELLLQAWNATTVPYPAHLCIHQLFEEQVERTPEATALVAEGQALSYAELNAQANRLAHRLIELGVKPDTRVAICIERSFAMVVGLLAILKAGGAYMPLDPAYPGERLAHVLTDAAPAIVLADVAGRAALGEAALASRIVLDPNELPVLAITNPHVAGLTAHHLVYVIYTSGSTGAPKGVMIEHHSLVNYATYAAHRFDVEMGGGSLILTSVSFDLSLTSLYPPLICGRAIHLCPAGDDTSVWRQYVLDGQNLSPVKLTPSHLMLLQQTLPADTLDGHIRTLVVGGETLKGSILKWWREHAPSMRIFNHYGPTETTVGCVIHEVKDLSDTTIPIGRPIANMRVYVLNEQLSPVPMGVQGELYIGGAGVARGYLNRAELTRERFIDDPFCPGGRLYKTGDLARWCSDGNLEYLGRNDHQVKLRGFRIELGEIEACLTDHPQVREAVVLARGEDSDKRLIAYVVAEPDETLASTLRAHVAAALPEYMMPAAFVRLETLPLTPNGKLDRHPLPAPAIQVASSGRVPRTPREQLLCELFAEVLGTAQVSIDDDFFELGGHSLLAAKLSNRIRATLGLELFMRDLFKAPTVAGLGQQLGEPDDNDASFRVVLPLRARGEEPALFCVHPRNGLSWCYAGLMRHLDRSVPIYSLQARRLSTPGHVPDDIKHMALDYVEQIRGIQPAGPYRLMGWSLGGVIAFEMACELQSKGAQVSSLALLDSRLDGSDDPIYAFNRESIISALLKHAGYEIPDGAPMPPLTFAQRQDILQRGSSPYAAFNETQFEALMASAEYNSTLMSSYAPNAVFDGDLLYFKATRGQPKHQSEPETWRPHVTRNINVHPVDCEHDAMMAPESLQQIATVLAAQLSQR